MNIVIGFAIKRLMMWILFNLIFALNFNLYACELKAPIISLSAPISRWLRELSLENDPKLLGISAFHHVPKFLGKKIPGGLYLPEKEMHQWKAEIFFDQSVGLREKLKRYSLKTQEVITRGEDPFYIQLTSLQQLERVLLNCSQEILAKKNVLLNIQKKLKQEKPFSTPMYFFVGEKVRDVLPKLLMVHDGGVGWWILNQKIVSYSSDLSYVHWSEIWFKNLKEPYRLVFLYQTQSLPDLEIKTKGHDIYISGPEVLAPGWGQIDWMEKLIKL
jgi:hypothetical protein